MALVGRDKDFIRKELISAHKEKRGSPEVILHTKKLESALGQFKDIVNIMGKADLADWQMINDMANLCEVMSKSGIGPEALEAAERTHEYLLEAYHRYNKTKKMGTSGLGLVAFRDCYEYHDLQRQSISRSVYEQMLTKTMNQIRSKSPDVLELK
jgi:hypothetical protein